MKRVIASFKGATIHVTVDVLHKRLSLRGDATLSDFDTLPQEGHTSKRAQVSQLLLKYNLNINKTGDSISFCIFLLSNMITPHSSTAG